MCGILVYTPPSSTDLIAQIRPEILCRGPDYHGTVSLPLVTFEHSVLSLRTPLVKQPVNNEDQSLVLCYNGQIYSLPTHDTKFVFDFLQTHPISELFQLEGEFALVFKQNNKLIFCRDFFGRRSLLYRHDDEGIIISSVGDASFTECEALGSYYTYDLTTNELEFTPPSNEFYKVSTKVEPESDVFVETTQNLLTQSVNKRLVRPDDLTPIAVLFSGGLDCSLITAILDDLLPPETPIYLLNVAFENRRTNAKFDTPDRVLALKSYDEILSRSKSKRQKFDLKLINVEYEEALEGRKHVERLIEPNNTIMDRDIALAFYFCTKPIFEVNPAIVFSGLGADELFAGYSRHCRANTPQNLAEELQLDLKRLPHRNLGRDDRVCSSWARDLRYPFLDSKLVNYAVNLPLNYKIKDQETKFVLRRMALNLHLHQISLEKKRAIQFGARSAKMDPGTGKAKGHQLL